MARLMLVLSAILGLLSAFILGSADFLGGVASKRMSALRVTAIVAVSGLVLLLVAVLFIPSEWSWPAVLYGGLSGITGAIAISLLYACLAVGPMSILSPLTAVVAAVVPMTAGLARGHQFAAIGYVAIGLALLAVILVGFVPEKGAVRPSARGLLMATVSGVMIGVFLLLMDATPADSGVVPLVMNRSVNAAIMCMTIAVIAVVAKRPSRRGGVAPGSSALVRATGESTTVGMSAELAEPGEAVAAAGADSELAESVDATPALARELADDAAANPTTGPLVTVVEGSWWRGPIGIAIMAGFVDAVANVVLLLGLRLGELTVISVLSAMYPAGTIILAAVILRERIAPVQVVGLVLAIAAAGMLAIV